MQEKESIMVVWCGQKKSVPGITFGISTMTLRQIFLSAPHIHERYLYSSSGTAFMTNFIIVGDYLLFSNL